MTASWNESPFPYSVLVHGGAGAAEQRMGAEHGCRKAAEEALAILASGGSALDAVQRAVELMEDNPEFNAGTGAALTSEGHLELDAALMEGGGLRAGGVCALGAFKHPIAVARAVLEEGGHVLYAGAGADAFARRAGFEPLPEKELVTERALERLDSVLQKQAEPSFARGLDREGGGTVGAVARDRNGHVAAATSTGGITGQLPGRVGDSPILGAGTYADDTLGAASATGKGEGILRVVLTKRALDRLAQDGNPEAAAIEALEFMRKSVGAVGGLILVAPNGRIGFSHTTASMPWAAGWPGAVVAGM